ncbi:MAG: hypothetical protein ACJ770_13440 [Gemmatimonadaceae bacterium]
MMRLKNLRSVQRLLPGAATLLTLSLAITLRVERSCSDQPHVDTQPTLHLPYPYPEMFAIYGPEKPTGTPPGARTIAIVTPSIIRVGGIIGSATRSLSLINPHVVD